ncbi:unnamed protein product [Brassica napus]|uniref:(rape) hypothetical protein n=2 Tax=Brassica TaxID=3705 RepID=A0A816U2K5_BRANA|nr:unnamed protein product [Brassica napus]
MIQNRAGIPVVASGGLTAPAAAGCLSSSSLFPSPPLSRLLLPLFSSADILTVVVSLSSWCGCPVIWPDLIAKVSDGAPVVVFWVTGVSSGVMRGGWLRSQLWISSGCSGSGGDSLLAVLLAGFFVLGQQSRWQRVLLAPLQIGCSSAVPCPVVLASLSRAESGGCGGLWFVDSPPRCSPIVVYYDSGFPMVSSHQQVVGLCSKAIFWRRVPGQAIIYRLVLICLLVPSFEAPDPACCALQPNPSSASCVVFPLALGYIPKSCFPFCFLLLYLLDSTKKTHSAINKGGENWTDSYWDEFASLPPIVPDGPIAIYGLGGGTAARLILELYPSTQLEGWEIDDILIEKAREYMELSELDKLTSKGGSLRVLIDDALSLSEDVSGKYAVNFIYFIVIITSRGGPMHNISVVCCCTHTSFLFSLHYKIYLNTSKLNMCFTQSLIKYLLHTCNDRGRPITKHPILGHFVLAIQKGKKNSHLSLSLRFFFLSSSFSFGQEHVKELKLFVVLLMEALLRNGTALTSLLKS